MSQYNLVVTTDESTVVAEYVTEYKRADDYQSKGELDKVVG
jgi:hypothetical protein